MSLTKEQLENRQRGIGGSDASVILGINPFKDIYELYLEKRGELPAPASKDHLADAKYWGSVLEEPVCRRYAELTGYKVHRVNQQIVSKKYPFMIANIDRRVVGEDMRIGFEAKTAARPDGWGKTGSSEVPPYIMCQVQHYLATTEYDYWDLGVLIGNRDYRWFRVAPIQDIIDALIAAEQEFWDRVEHGVPPEPEWQSRATTRLIKDLYPGTNGAVVQLPEVATSYHEVMEDAKKQRALYDKVVSGCQNRIAMLMGEASVGLIGEHGERGAYTRKEVSRKEYTVAESTYLDTRFVTRLPKEVKTAIDTNTIIQIGDNNE